MAEGCEKEWISNKHSQKNAFLELFHFALSKLANKAATNQKAALSALYLRSPTGIEL